MLAWRVKLEPDDNRTLLATVPAFPEVTTFGETPAEAERNLSNALQEAVAARITDGRDIPPLDFLEMSMDEPPAMGLTLLAELKTLLYMRMRQDGLTRAELQRRLGWKHREAVDRLFRLDHASRMDQLEAAFQALGEKLEVRFKAA